MLEKVLLLFYGKLELGSCLKKSVRILAKCGLPERWKQVSMLERVPARMPPTTNSLESIHGHLNAQTSRRNTFSRSLHRIVAWSANLVTSRAVFAILSPMKFESLTHDEPKAIETSCKEKSSGMARR
jgi:hypothetical protein